MNTFSFLRFGIFCTAFLSIIGSAQGQHEKKKKSTYTGTASYYHDKFNGRRTASGELFDNSKMTAASNTLSLGAYVKVTNPRNGKWVVVRINDRMNKYNRRLIDLSKKAAKKLRIIYRGLARVKVKVIPPESYAQYEIGGK